MKSSSLLFVSLVFTKKSFDIHLVFSDYFLFLLFAIPHEAGKFKFVKNKNTHVVDTHAMDSRQSPFQGTAFYLFTYFNY